MRGNFIYILNSSFSLLNEKRSFYYFQPVNIDANILMTTEEN